MARYFRYKTPQDLQNDAEKLGESIELSDDFSVLFLPLKIGSLTAGNRLAIQPMEGCDGKPDGSPDELTFRRYRRFGAGGAKMIWAEATAVTEAGRMNPRQLWIHDDILGGFEEIVNVCRQAHRDVFGIDGDLVVGLQLTHSGRYAYKKSLPVMHDSLVDPLTVDLESGRTIDESYPILTDDDLKRIEDEFVNAAALAFRVGFQFVDLKQCHRYLLSELLAAKTRPGEYGGSFENRTRLMRNIVLRIRQEVPELLIASRFNAFDGIPFQKTESGAGEPVSFDIPVETAFGCDPQNPLDEDLTEPIRLAKSLKQWGVAMLNVSAGNPYANPHILRPAEQPPIDGYLPPEHPLLGVLRHFRLTAAVQSAVGELPVMGSGYSWLQDYSLHAAAGNLAANKVSIVGLGRMALSHPDFAKTLQEKGTLDRSQVCRTFSYCTNLMRSKDHPLGQYPTGCPPFDEKTYGRIWKEAREKLKG